MLYISTKRDGKFGVVDSDDATIEYYTHDELVDILRQYPNIELYGAVKYEKFWDFKVYQPNFDCFISALRNEFGYVQDVQQLPEFEGKFVRVYNLGRWVQADQASLEKLSALGVSVKDNVNFVPDARSIDRLNNVLSEFCSKVQWQIEYTVEEDKWLGFTIIVLQFPKAVNADSKA